MLALLEKSAFSAWLLGSNSIWAYPTVLTLHTFGMMALAGIVMVIDLRLLGFGRGIPLGSMRRLFGITWMAFILNAITGAMMGLACLPLERLPAYLLGPPVFALCGGLLYGDAHRTAWSSFWAL